MWPALPVQAAQLDQRPVVRTAARNAGVARLSGAVSVGAPRDLSQLAKLIADM